MRNKLTEEEKKKRKETKKKVKDFLDRAYILWQGWSGKKPQKDFAAYLEVSESTYSKWVSLSNTTMPENSSVIKLANKLGDEIYDILGWERPDIFQEKSPGTNNKTKNNLSAEITQIVHSLVCMTSDERRAVEEYLYRVHKTNGNNPNIGTKVNTSKQR